VTPPPINQHATEEADKVKGHTDVRRTASHTKKYADAVKEVAASEKVACLDLWSALMTAAGWDGELSKLPGSKENEVNYLLQALLHDGKVWRYSFRYLTDNLFQGLHFSGVAYSIFFQEFMHLIQRTWPDQMPSKLPFVFPAWNEPESWKAWEASHK